MSESYTQGENMSVNFRKGAYYPGTTQNQTTTSTSQYTNAFGTYTSIVRVAVQNDTYIQPAATTATTATNSSMIIPANGVEFLALNGGTRLAHLQVANSGWISITELGST
jgi:hypothetical protein